jgi:hypothetical protein
MRVFLTTLMSRTDENKSCMRLDWTFNTARVAKFLINSHQNLNQFKVDERACMRVDDGQTRAGIATLINSHPRLRL